MAPRRPHTSSTGRTRIAVRVAAPLFAAACIAACGLSQAGRGADGLDLEDAASNGDGALNIDSSLTLGDAVAIDGAVRTTGDATTGGGDASDDGATNDAARDASLLDASDACVASGDVTIMLNKLTTVGDAKYTASVMRLTPGGNSKDGAAWMTTTQFLGSAYDFDFTIPAPLGGETTGDGFSFALVSDATAPTTGSNGENYGVCGLAGANGFAVVVDTYDNSDDANDNFTTNLKLLKITNGACTFVMAAGTNTRVDDGNPHEISVNVTEAGVVSAQLVNPNLNVASSTLTIPTTSTLYMGFTGATGGGSNSVHQIDSATYAITCK